MNYFYIENVNDFKKHYPYDEQYIKTFPDNYPCVLSIELIQGDVGGDFYNTEIIYDLSNFIYQNGCLYIKCNP